MKQTRRLGKGLRALLPVGASDDGASDRFEGVDRDADSILRLSDADDRGSVTSSERVAPRAAPVAPANPEPEPAPTPPRAAEPEPPPPAQDEYTFVDDVVFFDPPVGDARPTPEPEAVADEPTPREAEPVEAAPEPAIDEPVVERRIVLDDEPLFVDDVVTGYYLPEVELE